MFRNFNKLIPEIIYVTNKSLIKNKIPIHERWECRDFKIKNNNKIIKNNIKIPFNEQWETKDFILKNK